MSQNVQIRRAVRRALWMGALATAGGMSLPVQAQDAPQDEIEEVQTVVVTGTRIARQDYEAASPVISVGTEQLNATGTVTVEQLLNTLPQIVPDIAAGSNNPPGNGKAQINIRGLGPQRNLVLVDGRRMTSSDEDGVVDVNTIPTPLIERIEVITGGASAVYGADAVGGVLNFILDDNFSGAEISTQYGLTEQGDGEIINADFVVGGNFEEGRGNAVLYASYTQRDAVDKGDREFTSQADTATSYFPQGAYFAGGNAPSQAAVDSVFASYNVAPGAVARTDTLSFNPDSTLFSTGPGSRVVQNFRHPIDINVASKFFPESYSFNFEPVNKLILPLERTSLGAMGRLELGGNTEAYARVFFTNYNAESSLASSPAPTSANFTNAAAGSFFSIPVTNPFIPADLRTLLDSRVATFVDPMGVTRSTDNPGLPGVGATEDFLFRRRFTELGPRIESYENNIYQGLVGFKGALPGEWTWDVYFANGRYSNQTNQAGNVRVSAVEALLDAPDGGASLCQGGLNPFAMNSMSQDCARFVGVIAKNTERLEQNVAEAVLSGSVFAMPAGDAKVAVGFFYNQQDFQFISDSVLASGDVAGFNAEDPIFGKVSNQDAFVEVLTPLLADKPLVRSLNLTTGYRFSDHNTAGSNSSYKGELDWGLTEAVRFRGSYQHAVRAPSIAELFEPLQGSAPLVADPCNVNSAFRTGPDAAAVRSLCLAQGVPASRIDTFNQVNAQIKSLVGGNVGLAEEQADTFTVGVVWQPSFASSWLDSFSASVDYFNIKVEDAIDSISPGVIANRCYNEVGANPAYSLDNFFCNLFQRDAIGEIDELLEVMQNTAVIRTSGVDLQLDWRFPLGARGGRLGFNVVASYLNNAEQQVLSGDPFLDFAGSIGDDPGDAFPELKGALTTSWGFRSFDTMMRVRYIGSMINETVVEGAPEDANNTGVPDTFYVDLSTNWSVTEALGVRLGVENLLDQQVRMYTPNVDSQTDPSVYDVLGRKYFLLATYKF